MKLKIYPATRPRREMATGGKAPRVRGGSPLGQLKRYWAMATLEERQIFREWMDLPQNACDRVENGGPHEDRQLRLPF
jgi:hypothetical protein